jgi:hypothetical protein
MQGQRHMESSPIMITGNELPVENAVFCGGEE